MCCMRTDEHGHILEAGRMRFFYLRAPTGTKSQRLLRGSFLDPPQFGLTTSRKRGFRLDRNEDDESEASIAKKSMGSDKRKRWSESS